MSLRTCLCSLDGSHVAAGVDGFIIVDLPPEEAKPLSDAAAAHGLAYIPLVSPTTTDARMKLIDSVAHGFVYCVSLTGVTGARHELPPTVIPPTAVPPTPAPPVQPRQDA